MPYDMIELKCPSDLELSNAFRKIVDFLRESKVAWRTLTPVLPALIKRTLF